MCVVVIHEREAGENVKVEWENEITSDEMGSEGYSLQNRDLVITFPEGFITFGLTYFNEILCLTFETVVLICKLIYR